MNSINPQKLVLGALILALVGLSQASFAGNIDMINAALNNSLEERAEVTLEYTSNEAAERPENHFNDRVGTDRMELTINGELNGGGAGDSLKGFGNPGSHYRERHIEAKLDKEVKAIDREYAKASAPKRTKEKQDGFQYSEAKLRN